MKLTKVIVSLLLALLLMFAAGCDININIKKKPDQSAPTVAQDSALTDNGDAIKGDDSDNQNMDSDKYASAYLGVIRGLEMMYGEGEIDDGGIFLEGLAFVRLVDFDSDGKDELVCAYKDDSSYDSDYVNVYQIFRYTGNDIETIGHGDVSNTGNGEAPAMCFLQKDGAVYFCENYGGMTVNYYALSGDAFEQVISFVSDEFESGGAYLNGELLDYNEAYISLEKFEKNGTPQTIELFDYNSTSHLDEVLSGTRDTIALLEQLVQQGY